jgi:elongator complex protein 6
MTSRIPPLLEPYLALPSEASLILITSVLGASSNWLVLRFLYSALLEQDPAPEFSSGEDTKVLLVSFMRDLEFWKENARRLVSSISLLSKVTIEGVELLAESVA